jgi:precorrin-4 methylase
MKRSWLFCMGFVLAWAIGIAPSMAFTIGGLVRQPLNLSAADLEKLGNVTVRLNEVMKDGSFRGAFTCRGVPLKVLLELATVQKEESGFMKPHDLAVVVRNKEGKRTALSWGEIFYRNPSAVIVAFSAEPVVPHHMKNCNDCHGAKVWEPAINQLKRKVGFPKLVLADDFFADRNLEDIVHVEVVEMRPRAEKKQMKPPLNAAAFTVTDGRGKTVEIKDLSGYRRIERPVKEVSEGMGYHGSKRMSGASLREILTKAGMGDDMDTAVLASSVDGYRVLISYGELFLSPGGETIMVADRKAAAPLKEGKFALVFPDDTAYDRSAKALARVDVISLKGEAKIYVIGTGCADASLITLRAISAMGKADVFVAADDLRRRYSKYMGSKPVLFDPMANTVPMFRKANPGLSEAEAKKALDAQREKNRQQIGDALKAGKNVALLEYGDPTIYAGWRHWLEERYQGRIEIVPGLSAFNVANALIGKDLSCKGGSYVLSTPRALEKEEEVLKAVALRGDTVAIFMGLRELQTLAPVLLKYYQPSTPLRIVYKAGYSNGEHMVKTTLAEALRAAGKDEERHLGMIYIGPCVE